MNKLVPIANWSNTTRISLDHTVTGMKSLPCGKISSRPQEMWRDYAKYNKWTRNALNCQKKIFTGVKSMSTTNINLMRFCCLHLVLLSPDKQLRWGWWQHIPLWLLQRIFEMGPHTPRISTGMARGHSKLKKAIGGLDHWSSSYGARRKG